jgi:hypothetical protein
VLGGSVARQLLERGAERLLAAAGA